MSIFKPGILVAVNDKGIGLLLDYPIKKPLVGVLYKVLLSGELEWVYPEEIEPLVLREHEKEKSKDR